jgi:hypothetical protein
MSLVWFGSGKKYNRYRIAFESPTQSESTGYFGSRRCCEVSGCQNISIYCLQITIFPARTGLGPNAGFSSHQCEQPKRIFNASDQGD